MGRDTFLTAPYMQTVLGRRKKAKDISFSRINQ
jgi:hypothetical protein